ncbi:tRNA synthetases class I (C) catalytic domain-containing protein [Entophlyctis helioformis]|nr:tRNA synthetases class I (C) catalytic domain-containing protein [Entophlyctis helioformis]
MLPAFRLHSPRRPRLPCRLLAPAAVAAPIRTAARLAASPAIARLLAAPHSTSCSNVAAAAAPSSSSSSPSTTRIDNMAASSNAAAIKQPAWHLPEGSPAPRLHVHNSLTRKKELFVPENQNLVTWYSCGPTVYDRSHVGHARNYITFDIVRRILSDFFGYNVQYVMNITDIDDKIIISARQKHLFEQFQAQHPTLSADLIAKADEAWAFYVTKRFDKIVPGVAANWADFFNLYVKTSVAALDAITQARAGKIAVADFYVALKDPISLWRDSQDGATVTDQKIFRDFAAYWEADYFADMDSLNIRRPDVTTRVSEYVPEIIKFVQRIIDNGYAYVLDGSVYFDTVRFDKSDNHSYAKLEPWSAGNVKLMQEGEGDLTDESKEKRSPADFALWKGSKPGEPSWASPWGDGRPGWHIECSAMAGDVLGAKMDIHSGGIDLTFPHHDNELAQSEGHFECGQWVNYFLHAGHLHIEGQKMSKSLKNFISIKEALETYTPAQIRIMYLQHQWNAPLDYGPGSMSEARAVETSINNFMALVKAVIQESKFAAASSAAAHNYGDGEKELMNFLTQKQFAVHAALADSFNTPQAMLEIRQLVSQANQYYQDKVKAKGVPNAALLNKVGKYVTKLMHTFGVYSDANPEVGAPTAGSAQNAEDTVMPFLRVLSTFRDRVRELAQNKADLKEFLKLSDQLRDEDLVELGVSLEDQDGGKALVKLVDRDTLIRQRQDKAAKEAERQREKEERQRALLQKKLERLEKGRMPPSEMFKTGEAAAEFSAWDAEGIPTKDKDGADLAKSRRKKVEKEHAAQKKIHDEFLAASAAGEI